MRKLIDDEDHRMPRECGVQVELLAHDVAVAHGKRRHLFEAVHQTLGLDSPMRFDVAKRDIDTVGTRSARGLEHGVGLAHPRGSAKENAQTAAPGPGFFGLYMYQQLIGIRPLCGHESVRLPLLRIEREIQFQHIHARLAEEAERPPLGRGCDLPLHA